MSKRRKRSGSKKRKKKEKKPKLKGAALIVSSLDDLVIEMAHELIEAKKQVAMAIADEKRLAKAAEQEAATAAEWERRSMMAARSGDEVLAAEALLRKEEHAVREADYRRLWAQYKGQVDQLKLALRIINNKIQQAKRDKALINARLRDAHAREQLSSSAHRIETTLGVMDALDAIASGQLLPAVPPPAGMCALCVAKLPSVDAAVAAARGGDIARAKELFAAFCTTLEQRS